ncbi:hypothetical protein Tco_0929756 [Tanacetum coccineum]
MVDEQMVVPAIKEFAEPVVEAEGEQVITPIVDMEEEQMDAPVIDMEEDLAALFGDDDFEDDASDGFDDEEVWEVNEEWLMAPTTPPPMLAMPPPSVYEVGGPSTVAVEGLSFPHSASRLLLQRVNQVSNAEVAASVTIGELGPRVYAVEGQTYDPMNEKNVEFDSAGAGLAGRCAAERHADQLQTTVTEMAARRESTLMRCILGLERRIATLERRPPGPSSPINILLKTSRFLRWVEAEKISHELKMINSEDFSYVRCVLPLMYQLMAVKKTSSLELESSGSAVANTYLKSSRTRIRH